MKNHFNILPTDRGVEFLNVKNGKRMQVFVFAVLESFDHF